MKKREWPSTNYTHTDPKTIDGPSLVEYIRENTKQWEQEYMCVPTLHEGQQRSNDMVDAFKYMNQTAAKCTIAFQNYSESIKDKNKHVHIINNRLIMIV